MGWTGFILVLLSAVFAPLAAIVTLCWAGVSRTPFRSLGLVWPKNWWVTLGCGVLLGVGLKLVMKAAVLPALGFDAENAAFHSITGNWQLAAAFALYSLVAGVSEEIFFRGFLFQRLGSLLGQSGAANTLVVLLVSALFGLGHFAQGLAGVANAFVAGLVFGGVYLLNQRRLATIVVAHAAFDLTAVGIIYAGLESAVAHSIFR